MDTQILEKEEQTQTKRKKSRGTLLWLLPVIILFLLIFTTVILGSRLYELTTRDRYTVDLGLGDPEGKIELFRIEYENEAGELTVRGINADSVVAPGTSVSYDLRLRNNDEAVIAFAMTPKVEFLTGDAVPVEFRIRDGYGNYILGSDDAWASAGEMNALVHRGSIHPGEVFTYHVSWQWVFEAGDGQDARDTALANGDELPGVAVSIETQASADPRPARSNAHTVHLLGYGFGCCWCCWLVWILLLILLLLLLRMWFLRRRINNQAETLDEYEKVLEKHGLLVNGELVDLQNGK